MSRAVLVTGATGLIGGWVVRGLLERGDRVTVVRRGVGAGTGVGSFLDVEGLARQCEIVLGDVLAPGVIAGAVAVHRPDVVLHLAGAAVGDAPDALVVNARGTEVVLAACAAAGVERTVLASSVRVVESAGGAAASGEAGGAAAGAAGDPYAASKAAAEAIAAGHSRAGLAVAVARLPNVYGAGDRHASRLVPEAIGAALAGRPPRLRSDPTTRRDFLHAADAAAALLALAEPTAPTGPLAVGPDRSHTVGEVVALVAELAAARSGPLQPTFGDLNATVPFRSPNASEAGGSWRPRVALADGLAHTLDWTRRHGGARHR